MEWEEDSFYAAAKQIELWANISQFMSWFHVILKIY